MTAMANSFVRRRPVLCAWAMLRETVCILIIFLCCDLLTADQDVSAHRVALPKADGLQSPQRGHDSPPSAVVPDSPAAPPSRIALLHMFDGVSFFQRLGALTGRNKARYAARHGYDLVTRTPFGVSGLYREGACPPGANPPCWVDDPDFQIDPSRKPTFGKVLLAMAACNNRPNAWLLWSDADAMIVNQTQPLESIIDDGYDVMLSYDWLMVQAGVLFFKCTPWTLQFLKRTYDDREFDEARALDQSAFHAYLDKLTPSEYQEHVKVLPKHAINVYLEEYRPGDFLIHMAGKLYEATEPGLWAIANQFDILSTVDDIEDIDAFFSTTFLLNYYSGVCPVGPRERQSSCKPNDSRRIKLKEPLIAMSSPNRYRHVALRYYFIPNWQDKYDVPDWNAKRKSLPGVPHLTQNSFNVDSLFHPESHHDHAAQRDSTRSNTADDRLGPASRNEADVSHHPSRRSQGPTFVVAVTFMVLIPGSLGLLLTWTRQRKLRDFKRR